MRGYLNIRQNGLTLSLETAEDRIAAYLMEKIPLEKLHKKDLELYKRWHEVWSYLSNGYSTEQAAKMHMKICGERDEPISLRTAYSDIRKATSVWGDIIEVKQRTRLILSRELALKTFRAAFKAIDYREMNRAVANLIKIDDMLTDVDPEVSMPVILMVFGSHQDQKTLNIDDFQKMSQDELKNLMELPVADTSDEYLNDLLSEQPPED